MMMPSEFRLLIKFGFSQFYISTPSDSSTRNLWTRLKELRESKRLSQPAVADWLGVTRATISGYECNTIKPSLEQLVKLAVLYNTSLDYMMGMEDRSCFYLDDLSESQQKDYSGCSGSFAE